jgi:hypothetical protein
LQRVQIMKLLVMQLNSFSVAKKEFSYFCRLPVFGFLLTLFGNSWVRRINPRFYQNSGFCGNTYKLMCLASTSSFWRLWPCKPVVPCYLPLPVRISN